MGVLGRQPQSFATVLQAVTGLGGVTWSRTMPSKSFGKRDTMVPTRQHLASRAAPLPHPQAGAARGSRQSGHVAAETGVAQGQCSSPSFLLQTCAKACWGRRRGEEALAGFQLRLSSLAVPQYLCLTRGPGLGSPELGRGLT